MKKALLFDFDGVIADTFDFAFSINKIYLKPTLTHDEYRRRFDGNIYDHPDTNDEPDGFDWWMHYTPKLLERKSDEIWKTILKDLAKEYLLFIVSSTISAAIKDFLEQEDLMQYFQGIYGMEINKSKIKKIDMLLDKYGLIPGNCLFITDTLGDIKEAEQCGIKSVAVTWGYHRVETLLVGNPVAIVDRPEKLAQTIKNNL